MLSERFTYARTVVTICSKESGARFTKHLKPKIFLSSIQVVWNLRKS